MATSSQEPGPSSGIRYPFHETSEAVEDGVLDFLVREQLGDEIVPQLRQFLLNYDLEVIARRREEGEQGASHESQEMEDLRTRCEKLEGDNLTLQKDLTEAKEKVERATRERKEVEKTKKDQDKFLEEKVRAMKEEYEKKEREQEQKFQSMLARQQDEISALKNEQEKMTQQLDRVKAFLEQLGMVSKFPSQTGEELLESKKLDELLAHINNALIKGNQESDDVARTEDIIKRIQSLLDKAQNQVSIVCAPPQTSAGPSPVLPTPSTSNPTLPSPSTSITTTNELPTINPPESPPAQLSPSLLSPTFTFQDENVIAPQSPPPMEVDEPTSNELPAEPPSNELFITIPQDRKLLEKVATPPLPRNSVVNQTPQAPPSSGGSCAGASQDLSSGPRQRRSGNPTHDPESDQKLDDMKLFGGSATPPIPRRNHTSTEGNQTLEDVKLFGGRATPPIPHSISNEGDRKPEDTKLLGGRATPPIPRNTADLNTLPPTSNATETVPRSVENEPMSPLASSSPIPSPPPPQSQTTRTPGIRPRSPSEIYQVTPRTRNIPETKVFATPQPSPRRNSTTTTGTGVADQTATPGSSTSSVNSTPTPKTTSTRKRFGIKISPCSAPEPLPPVDLTYEIEDPPSVQPQSPPPPQQGPSIVIPTKGAPIPSPSPHSSKRRRTSGSRLYKQSSPYVETNEDHGIARNPGESIYRCLCNKTYLHRRGLVVHIRKMTQQWRFKCTDCGRYFFYQYEQNRHLCDRPSPPQQNGAAAPFPATPTTSKGKGASVGRRELRKLQRDILRRKKHIPWAKYTVQGFWMCSCGSKFQRKPKLTEHVHWYTLDWKFRCEHCLDSETYFFHLAELKRHLRKQHPNEDQLTKFKMGCHLCGEKFVSGTAFHRHRRDVHNIPHPSAVRTRARSKRGGRTPVSSQTANEPIASTSSGIRMVEPEISILYEEEDEVTFIEEIPSSSKPASQGGADETGERCRKKLKL